MIENNKDKKALKKTIVLGTDQDRSLKKYIPFILPLAVGVVLAIVLMRNQPVETTVVNSTGHSNAVTFPVEQFDNRQAQHFQYKNGDVNIKYFILKSSDNIIRAAFDACDQCWHAGKGYTQQDDFMVCNNCGLKFSSIKINEVKGGCNPAPLNRVVKNGKLIIAIEDIAKGEKYFNFKSGSSL